jgi:hypothetical protein
MRSSGPVTRITATFQAAGSDGRTYKINEWTEFHDSSTLDSKHKEETPGMKSYKLDTGDQLNQESPTEYVVVLTGEPLTKTVDRRQRSLQTSHRRLPGIPP